MNGKQIANEIKSNRGENDTFIRWWRKENDFVDYELIDRFIDTASQDEEFEGYQLVDTEFMWNTLKEKLGDRVKREKRSKSGNVIVWKRPGKEEQTCPFSPESIMTIFDVETRGNVIEP